MDHYEGEECAVNLSMFTAVFRLLRSWRCVWLGTCKSTFTVSISGATRQDFVSQFRVWGIFMICSRYVANISVSNDLIGCHKSLVYIGQQTRRFRLVNKPASLYWSTNPPVYIGQQTCQFILVNKPTEISHISD